MKNLYELKYHLVSAINYYTLLKYAFKLRQNIYDLFLTLEQCAGGRPSSAVGLVVYCGPRVQCR